MSSAYERARLAQIARNQEELRRLGLVQARLAAGKATQNKKKPKKNDRKKKTPAKKRPRPAAAAARKARARAREGAATARRSGRKRKSPSTDSIVKKAKTSVVAVPDKKPTTLFPRKEEDLQPHEVAAFHSMREWKRARARELGYSDPCVICHNRTLIEMVRTRPKTKTEMLTIWGIGAKRFEKHGELMLAALAPLRPALETHADLLPAVSAVSSLGPSVGEAHPDWQLAQQRHGLCDGPWRRRRAWCAEEMGCKSCLSYGNVENGMNWGVSCNKVLGALSDAHGSLEAARAAGWRWDAVPNPVYNSHNHRWWPPAAAAAAAAAVAGKRVKLPLTSGRALEFLQDMR
jgi:hypothetical protein